MIKVHVLLKCFPFPFSTFNLETKLNWNFTQILCISCQIKCRTTIFVYVSGLILILETFQFFWEENQLIPMKVHALLKCVAFTGRFSAVCFIGRTYSWNPFPLNSHWKSGRKIRCQYDLGPPKHTFYTTHTLLICEIEDKEEGESSRNCLCIFRFCIGFYAVVVNI